MTDETAHGDNIRTRRLAPGDRIIIIDDPIAEPVTAAMAREAWTRSEAWRSFWETAAANQDAIDALSPALERVRIAQERIGEINREQAAALFREARTLRYRLRYVRRGIQIATGKRKR